MSIFTKKLADWNLVDCIKLTIGTIAVGYAADKVYEEYQKRQKVKVNGAYDDDLGNDVYVQEEEETPE